MARMSPTARTLNYLKKLGCCAAVVEKWNQFAGPFGKRQDLFGCIDILAIRKDRIIGIQATSSSNHSSHTIKALAEPRLKLWLEAGGLYEIWSWGKKGKRGEKKKWDVRVQKIKLNSRGEPEVQE